jgi:hypothetical protein
MEHLDKLMPLIVLAVIAAIHLFLLFWVMRDKRVPAPVSAAPVAPSPAAPVVESASIPEPAPAKRVRRRKAKAPPIPAASESVPTPIKTVVDLLKQRDSLVAAFLLREIFAPRRRRKHRWAPSE